MGFLGYVYQCIDSYVYGWHYWREKILADYGPKENVWQSCMPSVYVDNQGDLYALFMNDMGSSGVAYWYRKRSFNDGSDVWKPLTPWSLIGNYSLGDSPNLSTFELILHILKITLTIYLIHA